MTYAIASALVVVLGGWHIVNALGYEFVSSSSEKPELTSSVCHPEGLSPRRWQEGGYR